MKKFYFPEIKINPITIFILILGILTRSFSSLFLFYLLAAIHESFHCLTAFFFKVKVEKITFHPLGFSAELKDILYQQNWKQILIYLSGPLSFFPSLAFLFFLYQGNFLSSYGFLQAQENNLSLLLFNLIPFYPLDGGRIFETIFLTFFPAKKALKIRMGLTFFLSFFLFYLCIKEEQWFLLIFLIYGSISSLFFFNKEYRNYLFSRLGRVSLFQEKTSKYGEIYHFSHNIFFYKNTFIPEEEYILCQEINLLQHKRE